MVECICLICLESYEIENSYKEKDVYKIQLEENVQGKVKGTRSSKEFNDRMRISFKLLDELPRA